MAAGFKWWDLLHNDYISHNPHVGAGIVASTLLVAGAATYAVASPKVARKDAKDEDFVPPSKFNLVNVFDLMGDFINNLAKSVIGHHHQPYVPLLTFIFMWTLLNNLFGLFPGLAPATLSLNTTLAMGVVVFVYYNLCGFMAAKHHFIFNNYVGHLHPQKKIFSMGNALLLFLGPVLFVIELVSNLIRPATLGIRLHANMTVDSTVHGVFLDLFKGLKGFLGEKFSFIGEAIGAVVFAVGPVPILFLGLLVAVIQAFVFTLLTTIYIGLATHHEEH